MKRASKRNSGAGLSDALPGDVPRLVDGRMVWWGPEANGSLQLLAYYLASHTQTEVAKGILGHALTNGQHVAWVAYERLQALSETWMPRGLLLKRIW